MNWELFCRGLRIGLGIAMPVGPLVILCIRRSLTDRWIIGLATGLAIATADSLYAILAAIGISKVIHILTTYALTFKLISASVIGYLGYTTLQSTTPSQITKSQIVTSPFKIYTTTVLITLTSPMTVLLFASFFADPEISKQLVDITTIGSIALGVTISTATWFTALVSFTHSCKRLISADAIHWFNIATGAGFIGFSFYTAAQALYTNYYS